MQNTFLLNNVQIIHGPNSPSVVDAVLVVNNKIKDFGTGARSQGRKLGLKPLDTPKCVFGPCLVDPHSVLEEPLISKTETIKSLRQKAVRSGYGQIGLLPRSKSFRDKPEALMGFKSKESDVKIHLWAGFTIGGKGEKFSSHKKLIGSGAIGLTDKEFIIPIDLIKKALLTGEINKVPFLIAPRDKSLSANGIVRESVEALRAGWYTDSTASETIPLGQLLELSKQHKDFLLVLMNVSTDQGVLMIREANSRPRSSVNWWHLLSDSSKLFTNQFEWSVIPSIGRPKDRESLKNALLENILTGIAVNSFPMNEEESLLPLGAKASGLSGHEFVLPKLWEELIVNSNWSIEDLWRVLSFGPSKLINSKEESLELESNRWLLFDPEKQWLNKTEIINYPYCFNQPFNGELIQGKVIKCGLRVDFSETI